MTKQQVWYQGLSLLRGHFGRCVKARPSRVNTLENSVWLARGADTPLEKSIGKGMPPFQAYITVCRTSSQKSNIFMSL